MARDRSPITKQSRREGYALHPKAHKIMVKRTSPPGQAAASAYRRKGSQYSLQLREKQKVKRMYGLLEKQFSNLMKEANKSKGLSGELLLQLLERRLDNTVYRAGFAVSRRAARQIVTHGHFEVNGTRVNIPSYRVKAGDKITVRAKSKKTKYFTDIEIVTEQNEQPNHSWMNADKKKLSIEVTGLPTREEVEPGINEKLIVEYYSR